MIEQGITATLGADAALTALIGERCYPVLLPQGAAYPSLTYQVVSGMSDYALDGALEVSKRIQFDAWGETYGQVKAVQAAVHDVLSALRGPLPDGCLLRGAFRSLEIDGFEQQLEAYRSLSEYTFHYIEG